jgi:two-component system, LytTR family, response regulator
MRMGSEAITRRFSVTDSIRLSSMEGAARRIAVKANRKICFLEVENINYISADGNYLRIHTQSEVLVTRKKISDMVTALAGTDLIRVHRSTIVNRTQIKELRPWPTGEYVILMKCGKELTLSRGFRNVLPELLTVQ